jgi:AcrR family transcriptional regulator
VKAANDGEPDTRQRILIEASRLLALHGYRGTTTRDIASAVGISQPSLFFHFPTKRAIVEELYRFDLIPALRGFESLMARDGTPGAKLFAMIAGEVLREMDSPYDMRAYISFEALNDPELAPFRDLLGQFDMLTSDLIRQGQESGQLTSDLIRQGQESGQFLDVDPWLALQMVSGFLARSNLFLTTDQARRPFHPEASASLVLRGLLADPDSLEKVRSEAEDLITEYLGETHTGT